MLSFNPVLSGDDHPATGDDVSLLEWLSDYASDGGTPSEMGTDQAPLLDLDGAFLSSWFFEAEGGNAPRDIGTGSASVSMGNAAQHLASGTGVSTGPDASGFGYGANGLSGNNAFSADTGDGFAESFFGDQSSNGAAPVSGDDGGEMLTAQDLIFLDSSQDARGGEKGKPAKDDGGDGGDGGGGGGSSDPGVLSTYTSGSDDGTGYNIEIDFKGTWSADLQQAFIDSAELLSSIITDDIADVFFRGKIIDDIKITAELKDIDGEGGILGQAGPTAIRTADYLPATAMMQFDVADADAFNMQGLWAEIVLHEMLHSIGFGTIWDFLGLVDNSDPNAPIFTGANATLANGSAVRVEEGGGSGTALSHWDDATYTTDIMTGYLFTDGETPNVDFDLTNGFVTLDDAASVSDLSNMTVASLEDLGYATVWEPDPNLIA